MSDKKKDGDVAQKKVEYHETTLLHEIIRLAWKIVAVVVLFFLLFTFIFGITLYDDASMEPSIGSRDLIINYRIDKRYTASDVIMVKYEGEKQARRVVAIEGDQVDITDEGLFVNGALQQEKDIITSTNQYKDGVRFPLTVGDDQVFILADNREDTVDSRIYGPVNIKDTYGKVMLVIKRHNI